MLDHFNELLKVLDFYQMNTINAQGITAPPKIIPHEPYEDKKQRPTKEKPLAFLDERIVNKLQKIVL